MHDREPVIALLWIVSASICDIVGNVFAKLSDGFVKKPLAVMTIIMQISAFTLMSFSLKTIDLSIAYAIWGAIGIIATTIISKIMFAESLHPVKLLGISMVILAIVFLDFSV